MNMLGNFSSLPSLNGGGNPSLSGLNQGLTVGGNTGPCVGASSHTTGSNSGLSGSSSVQRSLSVGAESLAFSGAVSMGLPASPLSFSSSTLSLPGSAGLVASSLARQGASNATRLDQQEQHSFQQLQQQQTAGAANPQFPQESQQVQQQQQQLEQHSQGQELRTGQQLQGQQILGGGVPQLHSQQVSGIGAQQQVQSMQGLASVKLEQQQMSQQVQSMQGLASVKLEQQQMSQQVQPMQGLASVKLEQQQMSQQVQPMQGLASVKLEQQLDSSLRQQLQQQQQQQQVQALQGLAPIKLESRQHDQALHQQLSVPKMEAKAEGELPQQVVQQSLLTSHLQRHEALQLQRQQSQLQAQMNLLQQQRLLQQQQLLQTLPQHLQRTQLQQQQLQQHLQQQMVGPSKQIVFEPGICARRLMQYMFNQRQRPQDNSITFWRKFVAEYFAPRAKKRWCVSQYGSSGRQPTGVFPQDVWHCEICGSRPGRGFETTVEVLPRLCKIKYDSGILDELLYVDISNEYRLSSGQMVLEYGKAIQESIFDQLRVVRDGQLRIKFSPDLKILSWEFCARSHEELLPRRLLVPQVTQLAAIAQKYQNSVNQNQSGASGLSMQELQTNCQLFVGTARQLARTLEAPTVNDLGYTKRYVRCLQISEVVNSMKDLIDFSRENGMGPMASLVNFPRRTASSGGHPSQPLQQQEQIGIQSLTSEQSAGQPSNMQSSISNNGLNGSISNASHNTNSMGSFPTLLHQNSLTSLQNSLQNNASSSIGTAGNTSCSGPLPSTLQSPQGNSNSLQNYHPSVSGQPSPLSTLSNSAQQNSLSSAVNLLQQSSCQTSPGNQHESSNAVHHLLQEIMMPPQLKSGASFQQALAGGGNVGGNVGLNGGLGGGVGNLVNNLSGPGASGNGSGVIGGSNALVGNSNNGNLGGINNSFSNGGVSLNSLSGSGSSMRNLATNMLVNNMGAMNSLGGRLNLSAVAQEQNLAIQDPSQSLLHELGGNNMLSMGTTSFNNLPFNWKSP